MRLLRDLLTITLAILLLGCSNEQKTDDTVQAPIEADLPESFIDFYERFHSDTAFQMQHIAFPLMGVRAFGEGPDTWAREEWKPHTRMASPLRFRQRFTVIDSNIIIETIEEKDGNNKMQRRFARMSDGWNLIYYFEMQPTRSRNGSE